MIARPEPNEIAGALRLLRLSESCFDHGERADNLKSALELFEDYVAENPKSSHALRFRNIKIAHTRRLLSDVAAAGHLDLEETFRYVLLLLHFLKSEVDIVTSANPALRAAYRRLMISHREEIIRVLEN